MSTILTLHDPQTARQLYIDGTWKQDTMYGLLRDSARNRPDEYALRDRSVRLTWRELLTWVDAVAEESSSGRPAKRISRMPLAP